MSRSLLSQLEQIAGSLNYNDLMDDIHVATSAEPPDSTVSGSLEYDINLLRSHVREVKDLTSDWYAGLPTYTAAYDGSTISGSLKAVVTATHGTGNVLDAKSIILPVEHDNSGSGHTTASGTEGILISPLTTQYADAADRRGLPIFKSVTNSGTYYDEGGEDRVCRVDVIDLSTDNEFQNQAGNTVYAKLYDGADYAGSGDGSDVYVKFYANDAEYTFDENDPTSVMFVYPQRKILSEMEEWEWLRTDFVSSWEGDVELIEDIYNLWNYTGASDDVTDPTWDNTTAYYPLQNNPTDLTAAINDLNDEIGNRDYTEENYVTDGETITSSIDALDQALADVTGVDKYLWTNVSGAITAETPVTLPYSLSYTTNSSDTQPGLYMDIYVDGQLLAADYATAGDNDYEETSSTQWTPHFTIRQYANITYVIRS